MKYITIDDICEMLSISRRTLERMRSARSVEDHVNDLINSKFNKKKLGILLSFENEPLEFPEPDLYIGRSPRWEQDKLISWLQENGNRLHV